ncbi:helix-turn-helix domain-containing protein [Leptolyngbya sp. GB1-A1]|uniref:helix-turn-helix domain-containing protein n=1 Tax=Leptolyngbya sp. GB1-A1 TaxID=2933908 RepID=UPI00329A79DC
MPQSLDIADLIVELRQELRMTQEQLAAELGVTFPTVNRWENRRAKPSRIALQLIQQRLEQMDKPGQRLLKKYFGNVKK